MLSYAISLSIMISMSYLLSSDIMLHFSLVLILLDVRVVQRINTANKTSEEGFRIPVEFYTFTWTSRKKQMDQSKNCLILTFPLRIFDLGHPLIFKFFVIKLHFKYKTFYGRWCPRQENVKITKYFVKKKRTYFYKLEILKLMCYLYINLYIFIFCQEIPCYVYRW